MIAVGNTLNVVGKIPWCQTMHALVNEHSQLEIDAFWKLQPVKVLEHLCDVLIREDRCISLAAALSTD